MQMERYEPPSAPVRAFRRAMEVNGVRTIPNAELFAKYGSDQSRFIEIDGTRIHYQIEGKGPPIVLLHGVLASLHTWDGWAERLREHHTVVRLDLPGFGLTGPMLSGDYTPSYAISLFEKIRTALGFERVHIAGNSLGGFLAWYYAVHHPERVDKLILLDPLSYPQKMPLLMRFATLPGIAQISAYCAPRYFIAEGVRQVYGDTSRITPALVDRYHQLLLREGNRGAMIDYFRLADQYFSLKASAPLSLRIPELTTRTLLMWGECDNWLPVSHVEQWKRDVPHLQTKIYEGVGHVPMEEIPERSVQDALAFLSSA
jgi:pimeloyl-ACP methyl ester carboxylesterase